MLDLNSTAYPRAEAEVKCAQTAQSMCSTVKMVFFVLEENLKVQCQSPRPVLLRTSVEFLRICDSFDIKLLSVAAAVAGGKLCLEI